MLTVLMGLPHRCPQPLVRRWTQPPLRTLPGSQFAIKWLALIARGLDQRCVKPFRLGQRGERGPDQHRSKGPAGANPVSGGGADDRSQASGEQVLAEFSM